MPDIFINPKASAPSDHVKMFSSFCQNPKDISFKHQEGDEEILLFLRKQFITNIGWAFTGIILITIPLAIPLIAPFLNLSLIIISSEFTLILILFYYLVVFSYIFISFLNWFYNIFIVTPKRIVDIDYSNIVINNVAETRVSHIEDVNYTQAGFIRSLINYGDLFVQTAGNEPNFEALAIPKPREATEIIASLIGGKKGS